MQNTIHEVTLHTTLQIGNFHTTHCEDFEQWYAAQLQHLTVEHFNDLSICTDGIYSFKNFRNPTNQLSENELIEFLLEDLEDCQYSDFLALKIRQLEQEMHNVLTDDLAIIRLISSPHSPLLA